MSNLGFLLVVVLSLTGCASRGPVLSGDFGTVEVPNENQVALLTLKSGEGFLARRLQEDEDTVFALQLDYSVRPVPLDSIARIEIRSRSSTAEVERESRANSQGEKQALAAAGVDASVWLIIFVLPVVVGAWLIAKVTDHAFD